MNITVSNINVDQAQRMIAALVAPQGPQYEWRSTASIKPPARILVPKRKPAPKPKTNGSPKKAKYVALYKKHGSYTKAGKAAGVAAASVWAAVNR